MRDMATGEGIFDSSDTAKSHANGAITPLGVINDVANPVRWGGMANAPIHRLVDEYKEGKPTLGGVAGAGLAALPILGMGGAEEGAVKAWAEKNAGRIPSPFVRMLEEKFPFMEPLEAVPKPTNLAAAANREKWFDGGDLSVNGQPVRLGHSGVTRDGRIPRRVETNTIKPYPTHELGFHYGPIRVAEHRANILGAGLAKPHEMFLAAEEARGYNDLPALRANGQPFRDNTGAAFRTHGELVDDVAGGQWTMPVMSNLRDPVMLTDNGGWGWKDIFPELERTRDNHRVDIDRLKKELIKVVPNSDFYSPISRQTQAQGIERIGIIRDALDDAGHHGAVYENTFERPPQRLLADMEAKAEANLDDKGLWNQYKNLRKRIGQPSFIGWHPSNLKSPWNTGAYSKSRNALDLGIAGAAGIGGGLAGLKQMMGGSQKPDEAMTQKQRIRP
jgi:hypothetical protein